MVGRFCFPSPYGEGRLLFLPPEAQSLWLEKPSPLKQADNFWDSDHPLVKSGEAKPRPYIYCRRNPIVHGKNF